MSPQVVYHRVDLWEDEPRTLISLAKMMIEYSSTLSYVGCFLFAGDEMIIRKSWGFPYHSFLRKRDAVGWLVGWLERCEVTYGSKEVGVGVGRE